MARGEDSLGAMGISGGIRSLLAVVESSSTGAWEIFSENDDREIIRMLSRSMICLRLPLPVRQRMLPYLRSLETVHILL